MKQFYIAGCSCVFHPGQGDRGVIVCGTLGDENLNVYRSQVFLAERLAQAGFPTLRISYYGTADSAGDDDQSARFQAWIDGILAVARWLRTTAGVGRISLCGVRIGAALAARAACEIDDLDSLILLAPVTNGRRFLREQVLAAQITREIWQSTPDNDPLWFEANGLRLDRETRLALEQLDISRLEGIRVDRVLLLDQPGAPSSDRLAARLRAADITVTHELGIRCDRMLLESYEAEVPHETIGRIADWLGVPANVRAPLMKIAATGMDLEYCREEILLFGQDNSLTGVLTQPIEHRENYPVVLLVNTGANPRFGTSRGAVTLARWLAGLGIASMRIDGSGIGDAALATGENGVPYSKRGDLDVREGVSVLAAKFKNPIIVFGMCSGAYHAFQAALDDRRLIGLILVNPQKFVWHAGESLSVVQRTTLRTSGFYLRNMANPTTWHRLLRGRINVRGVAYELARRAGRHVVAAADPAIAAVVGETQVGMVRRQLKELSARGVQILCVLSGNDPGLDEIGEYFGFRGWRLRRARNVTYHVIERADHTLSAHWARRVLRQTIAGFLQERFGVAVVQAGESADDEAGSVRRPSHFRWPARQRIKQRPELLPAWRCSQTQSAHATHIR